MSVTLGPYFALHPGILATVAGILGLIIGSFLNVVIYRLPVMLDRAWRRECQEMLGQQPEPQERFDLIAPGSRCPHCQHPIGPAENIPLLSYAWLRGRCRQCSAHIALRYPFVEFATGLLSAVVAWHFGWHLTAVAGLLLTWALVALTFIDLDHQLLPDAITLPFLWLGLGLNAYGLFVPPASAVLGAIGAYVFLWITFQAFRLATGKEGMGYGDFKLFALAGAWFGWTTLPVVILLASLAGALVGLALILFRGHDRRIPIPFGPYLCAAIWIALLWRQDLITAYLHLAGIAR